jgi:hypothetical protein
MQEKGIDIIYSLEVTAFVKEAANFCMLVEQASVKTRLELIHELRKKLAALYHHITDIPALEPLYEEETEKTVTEEKWKEIEQAVLHLLGRYNDYLEVIDPRMRESETPVVCSLAENVADIYQDLKDFITQFAIGTPEVMHTSLLECQENFRLYWGQKMVNILRVLHDLEYGKLEIEEEDESSDDQPTKSPDTSHWFISRRQQEWREEE